MKLLVPRSKSRCRRLAAVLVGVLAAVLPIPAGALIQFSQGDDPIDASKFGLPEGSGDVANLPGRIGYWEGPPFGGGHLMFEFPPADTATFQRALDAFAGIEAEGLELILMPGSTTSTFLKNPENSATKATIGFSFGVWRPENWNRLFNNPETTFASDQPGFRQPVPGPQLTLHLGSGSVVIEDLEIPDNIEVVDHRLDVADVPEAMKAPGMAVVEGRVVDLATGEPVAGARVAFQSSRSGDGDQASEPATVPAETRTGEDGGFLLAGEGSGGTYLAAHAEGYAPRRSREFLQLQPNRIFRNVTLGMAREAVLRGVVVTGDGDPVAGVEVAATDPLGPDELGYPQPERASAVTDAEGGFALDELPTGTVGLRFPDGRWHPVAPLARHAVPNPEGEAVRIVVVGTGTVEGRIDAEKESLGRGAWHVSIEPAGGGGIGTWGGSAQVGADGTFRFQHVPAGDYVVTVRAPAEADTDAEPQPTAVAVTAGETAAVVIEP